MSNIDYTVAQPSLRSEDGARTYYTRLAATYDRMTGYEAAHHREAIRLAGIRAGERVLEVACGTGRATVDLARAVGPTGRLDAVDLTAAMWQKACEKIERLGLLQRVEFRTGNARQLPFAEGTFDVLYNAYMFDLVPAEQFGPILVEFRRVLKPGGRLVLVNMSKSKTGKTVYESIYERGWASACRPVLMAPLAKAAGFEGITRQYRGNAVLHLPLFPFGTEIVTGQKPEPKNVSSI